MYMIQKPVNHGEEKCVMMKINLGFHKFEYTLKVDN